MGYDFDIPYVLDVIETGLNFPLFLSISCWSLFPASVPLQVPLALYYAVLDAFLRFLYLLSVKSTERHSSQTQSTSPVQPDGLLNSVRPPWF